MSPASDELVSEGYAGAQPCAAASRPAAVARMSLAEWLILALAAAGLLGACVLSASRRRFWTDEWLTYYPVANSSFGHMLEACADLINAAPPLYFVLGWGWAQVVGTDELSLRLFTSIGFVVGLVLLWRALRLGFGAWPVGVGLLVATFDNVELVLHNSQARFYGLYFAEIAVAITLLLRLGRPGASWGLFALNALAHAALVTTHYFGFVYSGALLFAALLAAPRPQRHTLLTVLSAILGWFAFVPWIGAFRTHQQFGGGNFWVPRPTLGDLPDGYAILGHAAWITAPLAVLAIVVWVAARGRDAGAAQGAGEDPQRAVARRQWTCIAIAFLLVPLGTWALAQFGTSLFLARYLFPSGIAYAVLVAWVVHWLLEKARGGGPVLTTIVKLPLGALALVHLLTPAYREWQQPLLEPLRDRDWKLPVAVESVHAFFTLAHYAPHRQQYVFVVDPEYKDRNVKVNAYQILDTFRRLYPELPVVTEEAFLSTHRRFLVLESNEQAWFNRRIQPRFQCRASGNVPGLFLVTRRP